ncbi:FKBP-type peptidyl-prolyl cis-trans isomerase [Streptomyces xinghaiensis]|uniref:FKBP-type peptidyl-prolyl cis-trans isomerase n=1 Tax=Streptomyces xinghaiensis TaxID=1038928 RepID=UPI00343BBD71
MRRIAALLAVPLLLVSAAACGDDDPKSNGKSGAVPAVSGEDGKKPKVAKGEGDPPKGLKVKVLKEGKGAEVKKGEALNAHYLGQTWEGEVFDNSYDRGEPSTFQIGTGKVIKGWDEGLVGQKLGSRVELVIPPDKGYGKQEQEKIPANSTLVFVVDLKKVMPTRPEGKEVPQTDAELPKVGTETDDKAPKVTIPKGKDAPGKVVTKTIIEGTGKEVGAKDTLNVHYGLTLWKDGKPGGDTWAQGTPQDVPIAQMPGWSEGLKGQKAGSRVMVVVPQDELTKEQQKQIKSDLVFVVDILGIA